MLAQGPITLAPSRLARFLALAGIPVSLVLILLATLEAGNPWVMLVLPVLLGLFAWGWQSWDGVRRIELRAGGVHMDTGDGCWFPVWPLGARISALAITLRCRRLDGGGFVWLNVWRDAVDDATFRRLARLARHGRWPRTEKSPP